MKMLFSLCLFQFSMPVRHLSEKFGNPGVHKSMVTIDILWQMLGQMSAIQLMTHEYGYRIGCTPDYLHIIRFQQRFCHSQLTHVTAVNSKHYFFVWQLSQCSPPTVGTYTQKSLWIICMVATFGAFNNTTISSSPVATFCSRVNVRHDSHLLFLHFTSLSLLLESSSCEC